MAGQVTQEINLTDLANYKVIGINISLQRGNMKDTKYYGGAKPADFQELALAIEASGEFSVTGFSTVYRLKNYLDGTATPTNGTADFKDVNWQNVILKRETETGDELKSLYVLMPIPKDEAKRTAVKNQLLNKTIGGGKVVAVMENLLKMM